jgi:gliding motility-associated-like protein
MNKFLSVTKAGAFLIAMALVLIYNTASAQLIDPFNIQYQVTQKGSIRFLGNTSTTCTGGGCAAGQAENPPAGVGRNNSFTIAYVNADTDPNTFSASSDSLVLPNCSEVSYAALYWGGQATSGNTNYSKRDSVRLRVNNNAYQLLRADSLIDNTAGYNSYHCFKDITTIVKANQGARFWVANVVADVAATNLDAGWMIVVVYKNDNEDMKNLTVFDGLASVSGSLVVDVPISGFLTPPSGPVNLEFGNFTHDGDRSSTGDSLLFNGTGVFRPVFDAINPANDVFNSTVGRNGVLNPFRLPNYGNTLGLDADIISPDNSTFQYIGNNATSATLRLKTGGETYLTQVLTTSIDVYEADVRLGNTVTDLNGGAVQAGDTLEYRIVVKNIGSDTSLQTVSVDTIAFNADYVSNSIRIVSGPNAGIKTDASADDQAEFISASNTVRVRIGRGATGAAGGAMGNSPTGADSTVYIFRATVTTDCPELACSNIVSNQAYIRGVSKISGNSYVAASNPSIFDGFGCPIPGATIVTVNTASCPQPPNITTSGCTPFAFATLGLPGTYSFFNTSGGAVVTTTTSGTYWAIRNVTPTCRDTIFISLTVNPAPTFTSATGTNPTCAGNLTNGSALLAGPAAADSVAYSTGGTFTGGTFVRYNSLSPANTITGLSANTYTIRVKTVNGCFIDRTVTLTNPTNCAPGAVNDVNSTLEDTPVGGTVAANDTDLFGGTILTFNTVTTPTNGVVVVNSNGTYTYTPNANYNGTDIFTYRVCDNGTPSLCDTATVTITVAPVNDAPIAVNDNASVNEDAVLTASVIGNDSDTDGPDADYSLLAGTSNGTLALDTNGGYVYTPNANFNGTDNFTYILCDDGTPNLCDTATVNITINAVNDAPIAVNDTTTTTEETPLNGNVTPNDSDIDGPASNYSLVSGPANGVLVLNISGAYTYTPNAGYNGPDTFVYALCDGGTPNLCDTATVFITVTPVNDAPVAVNDNASTNEDTPLTASVIANDNDSDGPDADYSLLNPTAGGTVSIDTNGTYTYTPNANFNGVDSFTYVLCDDGTPNLCDTATVTITVTPVNDPPVANTDVAGTLEGFPVSIFVDPNDFDIDGPGATYTPLTSPSNGSVTNLGNGQFSYSPFGNFNGTDSFTYIICDGGTPNLCDTGTVIIVVSPDNDAPDAVNDANTTTEDTPLTASVIANDTDVDGPAADYSLASGAANGTVTVAPNGDYTYTPAANFNGVDSFTYSLCDGGTPNLCDTAVVVITVTPVNDPPVANTDFAGTLEDFPVPIFVDPNDFDIDGPGATYTPLTSPANGSVTNLGNGQFTYSPFGNFNGTDSFTYTICDGGTPNLCDTGTVIIIVSPDNDAPVANDDANTTNEDTPLTASVIANDSDVDGPAANYTLVSGAANGAVTIAPNGDYTYTPDANYNGVDTFVYSLCDGGTPNLCDTATVVITITAVNDAPVANDDANSTNEDTPVNGTVVANDSDVDGPAANYTLLTSTTNGTVTVSASGNYTYTPNADFNGVDSFTYVLCDGGTPDLCDTAVVVITINPVNDGPVAADDANATIEDTPVSGTVAPNDSDIDGPSENYTLITQPLNGAVTVDASGNYTYTPNNNYVGTDSFTYSICDGGIPDLCDTAVVVITISPANDAPTAGNITIETVVDEPVSINVSTVCTDPENNPLTYTYDNSVVPAGTIIDVTGNGTINVTPPAGFSGTLTIPYTVCDNSIYPINILCDTATITINVIDTTGGANSPPVANDDYTTVPSGTPSVNITPLNNDVDVNGNPLTPSLLPGGPNNGTATLNPDGSITYTPAPGFYGNDTIPYVVCDNGAPALCDTAMIIIYVAPQTDVTNVGPVAADDFGNTGEDTPVTINTNTNDNDPDGNLLSVPDVVNNPTNGTVTINPDGTITYLPNANYTGTDSFTYRICDDGTPSLCDTATVYITINPANDAPTAADITTETIVDEPVSINVSTVCTDPENNPLTYTYDNSGVPAGTIIDVTGNGTINVTPPAGFSGTLTIPYTVCDNSPYAVNVLCDTAIITINVIDTTGGANNPPVANDDYTTVPSGTPSVNITPLNNDVDVNGNPLTPSLLPGGPNNGIATLNPDGSVTYTPTPGFYGNDTIPYVVCDNGVPALCDTAMIIIYIAPQTDVTNVGPVAADDFGNTQEDTPVTISILGNDNDPDGGILGTPSIVSNPTNGTVVVNGDGTITYTPNNNYVGNDTLTYAVCDNGTPVICDTATVIITIGAVNDAPYAENIEALSPVNTPVSVNVGAATGDPENNPLTYTYDLSAAPAGTVVTETGNGTIIVTPPAGFSGTITIPYSVCDNSIYPVNVLCDTATITVTIVDTTGTANNPVIANNDNAVTLVGTPVTVNPLANDFDVDGDVLSVTPLTGGPNNGTVTVNADGTITYTPNTGFEGFDTIPYQVCDNGNPQSCDSAFIIIYVAPQLDETNVAPLATDDYSSTDEDTPVTIDVLNNDSDPNGNTLGNPTIIGGPANGTVTVNADGTVTYTPDLNFNGTDTFTYVICDNGNPALCDTADVVITINPVNDPPVAVDNTISTNEDTPITIGVLGNDSDVDNPLGTPVIISGPSNGTAVVDANGNITYTPDAGFNGTDTIIYVICDGGTPNLCDTALVIITVGAVNDAPIAVDDAVTTNEDIPITIGVLGNDTDSDGTISNPTIIVDPNNGTAVVDANGNITYTPNPDFYGNDTLTYVICDNGTPVICDTAIVVITVVPVVDTPVIAIVPNVLPEDSSNTVCFLITLDPTANPADIVVSLCDSAQFGTATVSYDTLTGEVCITYNAELIPGSNIETDSLCLTITDTANNVSVTVQVPIEITPKVQDIWVKGFSPNGDGNNDTYYIPAADVYQNNKVRIFNRWGDEVWFTNDPYNNTGNAWGGTNTQGDVMPDGTYYFVFDYNDGTGKKPEIRFVVIDRGQ